MAGSVTWGWMADGWGRMPLLLLAILIDSIDTGFSAATPTGSWGFLMVFRILVGIGVGGSLVTGPPIVLEWTPSRHRTLVGGLMSNIFGAVGLLVASAVTAAFSATIGFRGLLLIGLAPAVFGIWAIFAVQESPRWLADKGKEEIAGVAIAKMYDLRQTPKIRGSRPHGPSGKTQRLQGHCPIVAVFLVGIPHWAGL
jgi:putative MFS transporter